MALAYGGGGPVPSTGIGNIGNVFGAPNSPGAVGPAPRLGMTQPMQQPAQPPAMPMGIGMAPQARAAPPAGGMIGQIMAQLHPQAQQAIRGIPREALQHLHNAGLIHPDLMGHLYGMQK